MSESSLWTLGLAEMRAATASDSPTPGGGSTAMVSAVFGVGLILMALRVSARKAADRQALDPLIDSGERLMARMGELADADVAVFEQYMAALKRPKATDEEKAERRAALGTAAMDATEVPLTAAQAVVEALDLALRAGEVADAHIVSDVAAGAALLAGAGTAVLYNVDVNLGSVRDAAAAADYATSRDHLRSRIDNRGQAVAASCRVRLGSA